MLAGWGVLGRWGAECRVGAALNSREGGWRCGGLRAGPQGWVGSVMAEAKRCGCGGLRW